jgi:GIY-YIG catalytic domain
MIGVYSVQIGKMIYVGASSDVRARWKTHKFKLKSGSHSCKDLQQSFNESSNLSNVVFKLLEEVEDIAELETREKHWQKEIANCGRPDKYVKRQANERPTYEPIKFKLAEFLENNTTADGKRLSVLKLEAQTGLARNTIYSIVRGDTPNPPTWKTIQEIVAGLVALTGNPIDISEIFEYESEVKQQ